MARSCTVTTIVTDVRRRTDTENATNVYPDAEVIRYISLGYAALYDLLVGSGLPYFRTTASITAAGTATENLPADHLQTVAVEYRYDGTNYVPLRELDVRERTMFPITGAPHACAYEVVGTTLAFYPTPTAGQVYRHIYVPAAAELTSGATTIDGISGWEDYITLHASIALLAKEGTDSRHLKADLAKIEARIEQARLDRIQTATGRVVDVNEIRGFCVGDFDP